MGHTTFLEAYKRTGRVLNITAVPAASNIGSPPKILNYLTAPDCVIWSAVLASSAAPFLLNPVALMRKCKDGLLVPYIGGRQQWRDGSLRMDIPAEALRNYVNAAFSTDCLMCNFSLTCITRS